MSPDDEQTPVRTEHGGDPTRWGWTDDDVIVVKRPPDPRKKQPKPSK